jgi:hypothetical protein
VSDEPSLTAQEFFSGKSANPRMIDLENGFTPKSKKEFVSSVSQEVTKEERKEEAQTLKTEVGMDGGSGARRGGCDIEVRI